MTTPRKLSARYELGEILGFGGMSEVHKARDLRLDRDVAVKVLRADLARDPTFYLRFRREAQNAAALNHPAIVAVFDTGEAETETGPLPFIVMEYVDGVTLRDMVRQNGPIPPRRAMEIIADVCAALDFSHRKGIVHRDVKPANIMLNRAGAVKVMDFGIARAIADAGSPMTQTAAVIGTAQYLSPEQAQGSAVDARSDVYSVGCVLYEILTGEPPFTGDSPVAVVYQHVREDPRLPSLVHDGVPRELDSVVLKAMSKNPANRYQTTAEMRSDLIRVLGGQKPSAPMVMTDEDRSTLLGPDNPPPRRGYDNGVEADGNGEAKPNRRRRYTVLALLVAAILLVGGGWLWRSTGSVDQVAVPDLTGAPSAQAQSNLQDLGFRVEIQQKPDSDIEAGRVIATRPLAGSRADGGSTVILEVSTGPKQVQVPKLTGLDRNQAKAALEAVGLRIDDNAERQPSSAVDLDKVIDQRPGAGVNLDIDSAVVITLGGGPEQVRVPNVVGQSIDVAQPNLEGAGFKVLIQPTISPRPAGEVLSTSPGGGTEADKGATVTVRVSDSDRIRMPDLTGQTVPQALGTLRAAGWQGSAIDLQQRPERTLDPGQVGRILSQTPSAGTDVGKTAALMVGVGALGIPG
ncbi:Stk1 family PASTA domain-containing Ser/Thr kinase [Aldersonia kunmingensis]|uniref:Stk1 family PASTA domain-containing Ser/Thr kinase n=1 Tax=Aldersonia kunmingensis TaxID=408066 RepID=UPI0008318E7E|nr:Stk1 family PASTA domain-containing Ser/Thr kinase [Aldersonia kunmingensis]